jgi:hypothetical protein
MDSQLEIKLIECLDLLDDGEPLDRILARFPDDAPRLRPLLETAAALSTVRVEPSERSRIASRRGFLAQAHALREQAAQRRFWLPRWASGALAALALVVACAGGSVAASAAALPDEPLYPIKRVVEDVQLLVVSGAEQEQLAMRFELRRRAEISALLAQQRTATVAFAGAIDSIQPDRWVIGGLPVRVDGATSVSGTPLVGWRAHVQGRIQGAELFATSISVEPGSGPLPTATATATAEPTDTPRPSATRTPRPTSTRQPTARPSPAPTLAPTNTPLPRPTPPPEPTPLPAPPPEEEIEFVGIVESTGTSWNISGAQVEVDGSTEIRDPISVGDRVKVRARRLADGRLVARRIELEDSGQNGNGNGGADNGNDNGNGDEDNGNDDGHGGEDNGNDDGNGGSDDSGGDDNNNDRGGDSGGSDDNSNDNGNSGGDGGGHDNNNDGGGDDVKDDNSGSGGG